MKPFRAELVELLRGNFDLLFYFRQKDFVETQDSDQHVLGADLAGTACQGFVFGELQRELKGGRRKQHHNTSRWKLSNVACGAHYSHIVSQKPRCGAGCK